MKKYPIFSILICVMMTLINYGCEKSTDHTTSVNVASNGQLTSRDEVGSCDQCPANDCCCGLELINSSPTKTIRLCGTDDGTAPCTGNMAPNPCSNVSGGGQSKSLSVSDPKILFCMVKGNTLVVTNTHASLPAYVSLTCQYGITNPQTVIDTIPPSGTHYYLVNNSCGTDECEP